MGSCFVDKEFKFCKFWRLVSQQCEYTSYYQTICFKMVQMVSLLCVFYQNYKSSTSFKALHGVGISNLISSLPLTYSLSAPGTLASLLFTELAKFISTTGSLHRLSPMPRTVFMAKSFWDTVQKSPPQRSYPVPGVKLFPITLPVYALHHLIAFASTLLQYSLS